MHSTTGAVAKMAFDMLKSSCRNTPLLFHRKGGQRCQPPSIASVSTAVLGTTLLPLGEVYHILRNLILPGAGCAPGPSMQTLHCFDLSIDAMDLLNQCVNLSFGFLYLIHEESTRGLVRWRVRHHLTAKLI